MRVATSGCFSRGTPWQKLWQVQSHPGLAEGFSACYCRVRRQRNALRQEVSEEHVSALDRADKWLGFQVAEYRSASQFFSSCTTAKQHTWLNSWAERSCTGVGVPFSNGSAGVSPGRFSVLTSALSLTCVLVNGKA